MATDLRDAPPSAGDEHVMVDRRRLRRRGWIVLAIGAWNVWVWGTRLRNVLTDDNPNTTAFDVVHSVLFIASSLLAVVLVVVGIGLLRSARPRPDGGGPS